MIIEGKITFTTGIAGGSYNINTDVTATKTAFKYFRIISQPANSTLQIKTQEAQGGLGTYLTTDVSDVYEFESPQERIQMKCDTVGDVLFQCSLTDKFRTSNSVAVVLPGGALTVQGPTTENQAVMAAQTVKPVLVGGRSGISNQAITAQFVDELNLNAAPAVPAVQVNVAAQNVTTGLMSNIVGRREAALLIEVTAIAGAGTLTVQGKTGGATATVLPIYDIKGNLISRLGVISATGAYYVDIQGFSSIEAFTNAFGAGNLSFYSSLSPYARPEKLANITGFVTFNTVVAAAATPVNMVNNPIVEGAQLIIRALPANTGKIFIGNSSANALVGASPFILNAGDSVALKVSNANLVWVNSSVNGESVNCIVEQA